SRRRHTRSKRDWSSDVCSSDLGIADEKESWQFGIGRLGEAGLVRKAGEQTRVVEFLQASCHCRSIEIGAGGIGMRVIAREELLRSEERRVGKGWRNGWGRYARK